MAKDPAFTSRLFYSSLLFVVGLWFVYWFEIQYAYNFNQWGIYPRRLSGLRGVIFSPFIHSGTSHLFNNSIPFLVLVNILWAFYRESALKIIIYGTLLSGMLTWLIARPSYHIGLSGVIYLLFSFIFFSGVLRRNFRLIAISLVVIFLYGSMVWYILPIKDGISWEGHLSGFLIGLLMTFLYRKKGLQKKMRAFTETEFDTYFDENGNFVGEQNESPPTNADE